jgi:hypothetical protein
MLNRLRDCYPDFDWDALAAGQFSGAKGVS